jgi:AraC-like DNA-binding protein
VKPGDNDEPPPNPGHPACNEYAATDYCRESWQLHLAELRHRPATHWHKCDYGRRCALVPIVYRDRCLAVIKLVGPAALAEEAFEHQVELLDLLARDFVNAEAERLKRWLRTAPPALEPATNAAAEAAPHAHEPVTHPLVLRALQCVEEHLSDPALTVGRVAREMDVHPNYLSGLFVDQLGERMSRFIARQRIERAKTLLTTTDWQIKRIAGDTGHANPNWFGYVFRALAGCTPGEFRRRSRARARTA